MIKASRKCLFGAEIATLKCDVTFLQAWDINLLIFENYFHLNCFCEHFNENTGNLCRKLWRATTSFGLEWKGLENEAYKRESVKVTICLVTVNKV